MAADASTEHPETAESRFSVAQHVDRNLLRLERREVQENLLQGALSDFEVRNELHLHLQVVVEEVERLCEREIVVGDLIGQNVLVLGLESLSGAEGLH